MRRGWELGRAPTARVALRASVWVVPALAAMVLSLYRVTVPELWRDELAAWSVERRPFGQMLELLGHSDAVSGGYYLLMHVWIKLVGTSPLALRFPSIAAMSAAAAITALIGRRLMTPSAGLVAGLVFAALPSVSRFAQEARAYAFAILAVTVATWLLLRALDSLDNRGRWATYGVAVLAVGVFNLVALCALIGHLAFVLMQPTRRREALTRWAAAAGTAIALLIPLFVLGSAQAHDQIGWIQRPTWSSIARIAPQLFGGILVAAAIGAAAVAGVIRMRKTGRALLALAGIPVVVVLLLSFVGPSSYWIARYLLFTLPAWCVLAAAATEGLAWPTLGLPVIAVALVGIPGQTAMRTTFSHNWANYPYRSMSYPGPPAFDYRGAARAIAEHFRPGDAVIGAHDQYDAIDLDISYYLPAWVQPRNVFVLRTAAELGSFYPSTQPDPSIAEIPFERLWVATIGRPTLPPRHLSPADGRFLLHYYALDDTIRVTRSTFVQLFVRRQPNTSTSTSYGGPSSSPG